MATNNILEFCPDDTGTNLLTQGEYAVAADRDAGNQPGIASSKLVNKALRQSAFIASQIAQYICDITGNDVLDNGNTATLLANIKAAIQRPIDSQSEIINLGISFSVAGNAATIAIKTKAGTDASATDPISVGFRSSTITSGVYNKRTLTGALSATISSGSTLGQVSGQPSYIYVYLIDNAGTLEVAFSHSFYPEDQLVTTTAEGAAGGADSATAIYSASARSNVPIRCVGYILNTQATAGTWVTTASQIQLYPSQNKKPPTITRLTSGSGTYNTPPGVLYLRVRMVGGGGGGQGSDQNFGIGVSTFNGGAGGDSTFGNLTAAGGAGGVYADGAPGGGVSIGAGWTNIASVSGGYGGPSFLRQSGNAGSICLPGGTGGANGYSPRTDSTPIASAGGSAAANTGTGGGGGGMSTASTNFTSGGGGGGAGYVFAESSSPPLASYAYSVGAGGTAGIAGTSGSGGFAGGAGGSGIIIVEEYYQ